MRSKVRTGDVFQITKNGPNYVALGKVRDNEGEDFIVATRNGNVTKGGEYKKSTGRNKPKVIIIPGTKVNRIHSNRIVNVDSAKSQDRRLNQHLCRTTSTTGVITEAPNIMVQIRELASNL